MYNNIIFDFDGVMVDSNHIRIEGFRTLYATEAGEVPETFMQYARMNGGLSRYRKIQYYYEHIQQRQVAPADIERDAQRYSYIVAGAVANAPEIPGAVAFLESNKHRCHFGLVSASDQSELREICRQRGVDRYFDAILGSPEEKSANIDNLLRDLAWSRGSTVYVGDSVNDREAAGVAGIDFIGFGKENFSMGTRTHLTIDSFEQLQKLLQHGAEERGILMRERR